MAHILEVIAYCIEACRIAELAGADRIELCDNPGDGGTTPSAGIIRRSKEICSIPIFPIIRPRGGDFLYSDDEFRIMKADISFCRDIGCEGVVLGLLDKDGHVDSIRTSTLTDLAYPMDVTFHRAFDRVKDPFQSLEDIIRCGCTRILTSGLKPTATEGIGLLKALNDAASGRITIMPGSGIRASNIAALATTTGSLELHSSAAIKVDSQMEYRNEKMYEHLQHVIPDREEIIAMKSALASLGIDSL
jgi:copper homeostasis protein